MRFYVQIKKYLFVKKTQTKHIYGLNLKMGIKPSVRLNSIRIRILGFFSVLFPTFLIALFVECIIIVFAGHHGRNQAV